MNLFLLLLALCLCACAEKPRQHGPLNVIECVIGAQDNPPECPEHPRTT
jgi:hypothetical protein